MSKWSELLEQALGDLGQFLRESDWYGRENELVNLFAHSFLLMDQSNGLQASQLGIEVAVKQLQREEAKALVRKDLVIWRKPNQTVWADESPTNDPAVVIEFKINDARKCAPDIEWLCSFTSIYPEVLGYSVCGFVTGSRGISYKRIERGKVNYESAVPSNALSRHDTGRGR